MILGGYWRGVTVRWLYRWYRRASNIERWLEMGDPNSREGERTHLSAAILHALLLSSFDALCHTQYAVQIGRNREQSAIKSSSVCPYKTSPFALLTAHPTRNLEDERKGDLGT